MLITTQVEIPAERIADMMVGAMEQNNMTRSWVAAVRLRNPTEDQVAERHKETIWYASPSLWAEEFEVDIWEISDESVYGGHFDPEIDPDIDLAELAELGLTKHTITRQDLEQGLKLMASTCAGHFGNMLQENDDNITHDVFLQCIVLKDVVYG